MAFNGSGVFNRIHSWATDLTNTVPVTASRMDAECDGYATGLSNTICRDGQSTTTARIPFASGVSTAAGTTASVAYAQTNDLNTGMYFPATDEWGLVAGGTATLLSTATALKAAVTLSPNASDGSALGTTSLMWSDLFLASGAVINFNNGNATMTHAAGSLTTAVTTFAITGALTVSTTAAITGAATLSSTLAVTGAATLSSTLAVSGTAEVTGNFSVNTNKFNVTAASGNTTVAGTLGVTGAATLSSTLDVTGASTVTGALTANNAAGVTAKNTVKAFGNVVNGVLSSNSFNVASVVDNGVTHTINFTNAMAGTTYTVLLTRDLANNPADTVVILGYTTRATGSFIIAAQTTAGAGSDPDSYSFMVLEG